MTLPRGIKSDLTGADKDEEISGAIRGSTEYAGLARLKQKKFWAAIAAMSQTPFEPKAHTSAIQATQGSSSSATSTTSAATLPSAASVANTTSEAASTAVSVIAAAAAAAAKRDSDSNTASGGESDEEDDFHDAEDDFQEAEAEVEYLETEPIYLGYTHQRWIEIQNPFRHGP